MEENVCLSNQKLQNSLDEIKDISRMESALYTSKGKLVAHTEAFPITDTLERVVVDITNSMAESQMLIRIITLYKIMVEGEMEYILDRAVGDRGEPIMICAQTGGVPDT